MTPPKRHKLLMSLSEILYQCNSVAALKEIEPDLVYIITKNNQPPLPLTFVASVRVRGKWFEAENTHEAGAKARAAQLVLYYFMCNNDLALKKLNVLNNELPDQANLYAQFTENPLYTLTLIKQGIKIQVIRADGKPPSRFTARVVIDGTRNFEGVGPSKKAAKNEAARNALSFLFTNDGYHPESSVSIENPISDLIRPVPGIQINIVKKEEKSLNTVFTARVVLNGRNYDGISRLKRVAMKKAAHKALSSLSTKISNVIKLKTDIRACPESLKKAKTLQNLDQMSSTNLLTKDSKAETLKTKKYGLNKLKQTCKTVQKSLLAQHWKYSDAKNHIRDLEYTRANRKGKKPKNVVLEALFNNPFKPEGLKMQTDGLNKISMMAKKDDSDRCGNKLGAKNLMKSVGVAGTDDARGILYGDSNPTRAGSNEDPLFNVFGDHIAGQLIESTYQSIKEADPSVSSYKVLAGVVMTSGPTSEGSRVISVATGSKSISRINFSLEGRALNDCHAEILARRGLVNFLYDQLESYMIHPEESIYEPVGNVDGLPPRLRIKNHILFHLYISSAPCGCASETYDHQGTLRVKVEASEETVPVTEKRIPSSKRFLFDENLISMSCTDKMTRWNVVGIQGSLLTHITNPIYFHTVVIGNHFNLDNLRSSLIERVINLQGISAPFAFVEPVLVGTTSSISTSTKGPCIPISPFLSVCWVRGWMQHETIDSINGKLQEDGSFSSLCKRKFFQRFILLVSKKPEWFQLIEDGKISYRSLKKAAKRFRKANELLMASLLDSGLGHWVQKPEGS